MKRNRAIMRGKRLVVPAERMQRQAAIGVRGRIGALQPNRLLISGERLVKAADVLERRAAVDMDLGDVGAQGERAIVALQRLVAALHRGLDETEQMPGVEKIRLRRDDGAAQSLGLVQTTALESFESASQFLRQRCGHLSWSSWRFL
jgi:hypothetical protein